jgi:hypothetical protein
MPLAPVATKDMSIDRVALSTTVERPPPRGRLWVLEGPDLAIKIVGTGVPLFQVTASLKSEGCMLESSLIFVKDLGGV